MKTVAVAELKARLSRYLRRVKAGEEILVTERKIPVARLVPIAHGAAGLDAIRDLEQQGLMRLGTASLPKDFWTLARGRDRGAAVRKAVEEERRRGW